MKTKIINLTPHTINLYKNNELTEVLESKGIARVETEDKIIGYALGYTIKEKIIKGVYGLPEKAEGIYYIVSRMVAETVKREDLLIPNDSVRDNEGRIIGCSSFAKII